MSVFLVFLVSLGFVLTWACLRLLIPRLKNDFVDKPNFRSSHELPTPRGGGLSFVIVSCFSSGVAWIFIQSSMVSLIPLIVLPIGLVGLLDDKYNLPSSWRYAVQLVISALLISVSPLASHLFTFIIEINVLLLVLLLLVSITAIINFSNFMDGLDGLVAGCMAVLLLCSAFKFSDAYSIWVLFGSLIGFLIWNWSPAQVFMGDVGSTFLGAVFAGLVLQAPNWQEALGLLLVATPLLGDACLCVPRRLIAGERVFQAHRLHLFQRLHQAGWPHSRVSIMYISATTLLAIALILGGLPWVITFAALELLIGIWLDQVVAIPFVVASRN